MILLIQRYYKRYSRKEVNSDISLRPQFMIHTQQEIPLFN